MNKLATYFETAQTADPAERRFGIEIETLFIDEQAQPLTCEQGESVFEALVGLGWQRDHDLKAVGRELCLAEFALKPEVGAGNIELISPPRPVGRSAELFDETVSHLEALYEAASTVGARPLFTSHDGFPEVDNIVLDNDRDRQWAQVDGRQALRGLGHIASLHLTVDLTSISEGFAFIRELNALARRREWPSQPVRQTWKRYLERSRATYDPRRFGAAPESFDGYIALLEGFSVVVDRASDSGLVQHTPGGPKLADAGPAVDLPTFLGTVWLHTRLRRIAGALALEVRFVPRADDQALREDLQDVLDCML